MTKVIGENGKTSAHYNYDEFGRPLPTVKFDQNWPGPDNTFGYTGYQYDVSAGLWYAQARYYMPEIGRFISEDPWSGTIATPTTMNPYPYVLNNPLKYVDPLGLQVDAGGGSSGVLNKDSNSTNNISNQVEKQGTKNGSDAFYGNLEGRNDENILVVEDYAKIRALQFIYANTDSQLVKDGVRYEAVQIRQKDKYDNKYNNGKYIDDYEYTFSLQEIKESFHIHFEEISLSKSQWLNGNNSDAIAEGSGVFGPLAALGIGIFTMGVEKIPAEEGDLKVTLTWGSSSTKRQINYYFREGNHDNYHKTDWGTIEIHGGGLIR